MDPISIALISGILGGAASGVAIVGNVDRRN